MSLYVSLNARQSEGLETIRTIYVARGQIDKFAHENDIYLTQYLRSRIPFNPSATREYHLRSIRE